jgi:protein-tyrosine kinase
MTDPNMRLNLIQRAMERSLQSPSVAVSAAPKEVLAARPEAPIEISAVPGDAKPKGRSVSLNFAQLRESRIPLPGDRGSLTFNEFRGVKRKLLPLTKRPGTHRPTQNVVMITSALPAEGKTFTSMNLAITLATEKNLDVILIDGDVIRSSLTKYFVGQSELGLIDLFGSKPCTIEDTLHDCVDLPNLHILFAGSHNDTAPELFASSRMAELFELLAARYPNAVIVVDSPPVLATSEPTALVTHIDHLIMVVAASRSSRHQVETSLSALTGCRSIMLLFNKAPKWQRPSQGTYYYYANHTAQ